MHKRPMSWISPGGCVAAETETPLSRYHNRISVTSAVSAAEVLAAAEEVLGGVGVRHRYVSVDNDALGQASSADFVLAGYGHETIVTMAYSGPDVTSAAHQVQEVSLDMLRPASNGDWRDALPDATDELLSQLADRTALYARGAELTRLAVFEGDEIAATRISTSIAWMTSLSSRIS